MQNSRADAADLRYAFATTVRRVLVGHPDQIDSRKVFGPASDRSWA